MAIAEILSTLILFGLRFFKSLQLEIVTCNPVFRYLYGHKENALPRSAPPKSSAARVDGFTVRFDFGQVRFLFGLLVPFPAEINGIEGRRLYQAGYDFGKISLLLFRLSDPVQRDFLGKKVKWQSLGLQGRYCRLQCGNQLCNNYEGQATR